MALNLKRGTALRVRRETSADSPARVPTCQALLHERRRQQAACSSWLDGSAIAPSMCSSRAALAGARRRLGDMCVAQVAATIQGTSTKDCTFQLRNGCKVKARVDTRDNGDQHVELTTDLQAGRLLFHWGVEGGKDYRGGWRLPGSGSRPEGTVQYKDRALQSPWRGGDGGLQLTIDLKGDEASDTINFVLKDEATNTWYDNNGSNFAIRLRTEEGSDTEDTLPTLPKDLCDKWAWMKWDHSGRPNRSAADAGAEYDRGVLEMQDLLRRKRPLDELWKVANGHLKYADYLAQHGSGVQAAAQAPAKPQRKEHGPIPDDIVGIQAYLLWEKAGKPNNADFSGDARRKIEEQVNQGKTYDEIRAKLKGGPAPQQQQQQQKQQQPKQEQKPQPRKEAPQASVGKSLDGVRGRNPLDLIKKVDKNTPKLSAEKSAKKERPLDAIVQRLAVDPTTKWRRTFPLGGSKSELLCAVRQSSEAMPVRVDLITDNASELVLHWGTNKPKKRDWMTPPEETWPEHTTVGGNQAADTKLVPCDDEECQVEIGGTKVPLQWTTIYLPADHTVGSLSFVLRSADKSMWYKDPSGGDFYVPVPGKASQVEEEEVVELPDDLCRAIVDAENSSAWTLMHRFNKATDLLNESLNGYFDMDMADAMSRIFVWLRYSSTRQLTWQRNYNTQPRILSAAQERLTNAIASAHSKTSGEAQEWVRMMLTTVGRGGDGQRIRDEILHIMHRNHIPEKKGLWMEEWHQKLHNNTTPDDVPICEAYLAFLDANGNREAYWRVLSDAGLTRERLESFDRPITLEPDYWPEKRDALKGEFRNYLGILKNVHSGADLQASATAVGNKVPESAKGYLMYVLSHVGDSQILPLMEAAVEARTELASHARGNRELLYLDLALEDQVRQAAERGVGAAGFGAAAFMKPLLQNLCLSLGDNEELCYCLKTWLELPASVRTGGRPNKEEALQAVAVLNRIRRAISEVSDRCTQRIGEAAKAMGKRFGVDDWACELFAEEVVRGGPAFAVSLVISSVEPVLRNAAALGAWQVISPSPATGVVDVVDGLYEVQDKTYPQPTVLIAKQVTGEEEIPDGVVAVLTPDAPDVLSHVSVRARNMRVLFATCHDPKPLDDIAALKGKTLQLNTTASGNVSWAEAKAGDLEQAGDKRAADKKGRNLAISVPKWCGKWAVGMDEYKDGVVGAKSKNLAGLRGKLPDNIKLPASVTLPFGCFEQCLELPENKDIKQKLQKLVAKLNTKSKATLLSTMQSLMSMDGGSMASQEAGGDKQVNAAKILAECRNLAMAVKVPPQVKEELSAAMKAAGIPAPDSDARWEHALTALKGVWASKYNDRAYYSLRKVDLNFDDVRMAVLVQRVVPAQYAFVIHTKNPSNNDPNEVFCELVRGLGESLVSGMIPGSAIAFKAPKDKLEKPEVLCYASKSEGMFVPESLIFRSDSNGEDLEGYAGAGLYESITMDKTETKRVDYMDDKLMSDAGFRTKLLSDICKVGNSIEQALGSAQDIEGVVGPDNVITVVQTRPQV